VRCWGTNASGQLGLGDTLRRGATPGELGAALPAVDISPGPIGRIVAGNDTTCVISVGVGGVRCWGNNPAGRLGLGDSQSRGGAPNQMGGSLPAVPLGTGLTAQNIARGFGHTCAQLNGGVLKCWGSSFSGQNGLGTAIPRGSIPGDMGDNLPAVDLGGVVAEVGAGASCARLVGGALKCWGWNDVGQLGIGDTQNRGDEAGEMGVALPAVDLGPGRSVVQVASSGRFTCAILDDATVKCWGENSGGQLGMGDTSNRGATPAQMGANLPAVRLE
jgi:alpha-tubulin suppressor-like RCC1 family protein